MGMDPKWGILKAKGMSDRPRCCGAGNGSLVRLDLILPLSGREVSPLIRHRYGLRIPPQWVGFGPGFQHVENAGGCSVIFDLSVAHHPLVRFFPSPTESAASRPIVTPLWDLQLLLDGLTRPPFKPI